MVRTTEPRPEEVRFPDLSQDQKNALLDKWGSFSGIRIRSRGGPDPSPLRIARLGLAPIEIVATPSLHEKMPSTTSRYLWSKETSATVSTPSKDEPTSAYLAPDSAYVQVEATTVFTEQAASFLRRGWSAELFHDSTPWVPRVDMEGTTAAGGTWPATAHIVVRIFYSRTSVRLEHSELEPSEGFVAAVNDALTQPSVETKTRHLQEALERWGHVLPIQFDVGGVAYATKRLLVSSKTEIPDKEEELKRQLIRELATSEDDTSSSEAIPVNLTGGDTLQFLNHANWLASLRNSDNWVVIKVNAVTPTVRLLGKATFERVQSLTRTPLYHFPSRLCSRSEKRYTVQSPEILGERSAAEDCTGGSVESGPIGSAFDSTSDFTITAWFRSSGEHLDRWHAIVSLECLSQPLSVVWIGQSPNSNVIEAQLCTDGGRQVLRGISDIKAKTWTHVAFSQKNDNGQRKVVLYVDGRKDGSSVLAHPLSQDKKMEIVVGRGKYDGKPSDDAWDGQVEDVKFYDCVLSKPQRLKEAAAKSARSP